MVSSLLVRTARLGGEHPTGFVPLRGSSLRTGWRVRLRRPPFPDRPRSSHERRVDGILVGFAARHAPTCMAHLMTSSPRVPALYAGDRLTRDEFERRYAAMPEVKKAELIEGVNRVVWLVLALIVMRLEPAPLLGLRADEAEARADKRSHVVTFQSVTSVVTSSTGDACRTSGIVAFAFWNWPAVDGWGGTRTPSRGASCKRTSCRLV